MRFVFVSLWLVAILFIGAERFLLFSKGYKDNICVLGKGFMGRCVFKAFLITSSDGHIFLCYFINNLALWFWSRCRRKLVLFLILALLATLSNGVEPRVQF